MVNYRNKYIMNWLIVKTEIIQGTHKGCPLRHALCTMSLQRAVPYLASFFNIFRRNSAKNTVWRDASIHYATCTYYRPFAKGYPV